MRAPPVADTPRRVSSAAHRLPAPTNRSRRLIPLTYWLLFLYYGALMKEYFPAGAAALPDARAARRAPGLQQRIGEQVDLVCQLAAVKVGRLPMVLDRSLLARRERLQHIVAAVAAAGGADLPEVLGRHRHQSRARAGEFRPMEDRLPRRSLPPAPPARLGR